MKQIYHQKRYLFSYEIAIFITQLLTAVGDILYLYNYNEQFYDSKIGNSFYHQFSITIFSILFYKKITCEGFRLPVIPAIYTQIVIFLMKLFQAYNVVTLILLMFGIILYGLLIVKLPVYKFPQVTGIYKNIGYKIINFDENQFNKEIAVFYPAFITKGYKKEDMSWVPNQSFYKTWCDSLKKDPGVGFRVFFGMLLSFMEKINIGVCKNAPIIKDLSFQLDSQKNQKKARDQSEFEHQSENSENDDNDEDEDDIDTLIKNLKNNNNKKKITKKAEYSEQDQKLKIIIFSHGYLGHLNTYVTYCKELASQGYVVFTLQHYEPVRLDELNKLDRTEEEKLEHVKEQRQQHLEWRSIQIYNLINFIKQNNGLQKLFPNEDFQIETQEFVLMGHSFGAASALYSGLLDFEQNIKAVIGFDAWLFPMKDELLSQKSDIPIMFINSETFARRSPEYKIAERNKIFFKSQSVTHNKYMGYLRDSDHIHPSDVPFLIPNEATALKMIRSTHNITNIHFMLMDLTVNFLENYVYSEKYKKNMAMLTQFEDQNSKIQKKQKKQKIEEHLQGEGLEINNDRKQIESQRELEQENKQNMIISPFFDFCEQKLRIVSPLETQFS